MGKVAETFGCAANGVGIEATWAWRKVVHARGLIEVAARHQNGARTDPDSRHVLRDRSRSMMFGLV